MLRLLVSLMLLNLLASVSIVRPETVQYVAVEQKKEIYDLINNLECHNGLLSNQK